MIKLKRVFMLFMKQICYQYILDNYCFGAVNFSNLT